MYPAPAPPCPGSVRSAPAPTIAPERSVSRNTSRRAGRGGVPAIVVGAVACQRPVRSKDHGSGVAAAAGAAASMVSPELRPHSVTATTTSSARAPAIIR